MNARQLRLVKAKAKRIEHEEREIGVLGRLERDLFVMIRLKEGVDIDITVGDTDHASTRLINKSDAGMIRDVVTVAKDKRVRTLKLMRCPR